MPHFTILSVQPRGEQPMTYAAFLLRWAKAQAWYHPQTDADRRWWETATRDEQQRQKRRYERFAWCGYVTEIAQDAFSE